VSTGAKILEFVLGGVGVYWEVLIFIRLKAEVILQGLVVWFIGVVIVLCILLSREFL
jgi:hypothetical protein